MNLPKYTYLYGFTKEEITALADSPYKEAIEYKIRAAKALSIRLLSDTYMESDTVRVKAVLKAVKFNEELLEELEWV